MSCWTSGRAGHELLPSNRHCGGPFSSGQLAPGTRLPSSRELALELGCARATVVAAYEQLVAEGYLRAEARIGHDRRRRTTDAAESLNPSRRSSIFTELLPGEPDPSSFPRQAWAAALRKVLHTHPDSVLGYGDRQGLAELRVALASYLARSRVSGCRSVARS